MRNIASRNHERNTLIICTVNYLYPFIVLSYPYSCSFNCGFLTTLSPAQIIQRRTLGIMKNVFERMYKEVAKYYSEMLSRRQSKGTDDVTTS